MFLKQKSRTEKASDWASEHSGFVAVGSVAALAIGVVVAALIGEDDPSDSEA